MRRFLIAVLLLTALLNVCSLNASVCDVSRSATEVSGFSVDHYITDAMLHRRWAVMVDCNHPDRPWTLRATPLLAEEPLPPQMQLHAKQAKVVLLVRAGAKVRIWRNAGGARIDLSGTALESGAIGQTIHVRTGQGGPALEGKVRGAESVELLVPDHWQNEDAGRWRAQ